MSSRKGREGEQPIPLLCQRELLVAEDCEAIVSHLQSR